MTKGTTDVPRIETAEQYRIAIEEMQRLDRAGEDGTEFRRRQALQAALADYESRNLPPRPPGLTQTASRSSRLRWQDE
jgi:hypothetical protein